MNPGPDPGRFYIPAYPSLYLQFLQVYTVQLHIQHYLPGKLHCSFRFRGTRTLAVSAEYRFGLLRLLELAAFYDGGEISGGVEALGSQGYRVIGVVAQQGRTLGQSQDNQVWIPARTWRQSFGSRRSIDILVEARGGVAGLSASVDEVRAVLRALRHTSFNAPDPFGIVTVERLQALWGQISGATIIFPST